MAGKVIQAERVNIANGTPTTFVVRLPPCYLPVF